MSAETEAAVADAIRAHIADVNPNDPRLLTDWHVIAAHVGMTADETGYTHVLSHSPFHVHLGLAHMGVRYLSADGPRPETDDEAGAR